MALLGAKVCATTAPVSRQRQADFLSFDTSLIYIAGFRPVRDTYQDLVLKKRKETIKTTHHVATSPKSPFLEVSVGY